VRGARAYLAVHGGIGVPPVLGSRATSVSSRIGGLEGRALKTGDRVPLGEPPPRRRSGGTAARFVNAMVPDGRATVRVLPGPHTDCFDPAAMSQLQTGDYVVGDASDRMGFRLQGAPIRHAGSADIISDVTPLGAIQVPASGQPLLLMADRQTTGGYPLLATVITADIGLAGQLGPGDTIAFRACTRQEAVAALIERERLMMGLAG
jgi:biotin-dependent carboxylase-like uncharacterized protein